MTVINTYNENSLHKTLKQIYALEFNGQTEQKAGSYICDIITKDSQIIEIQTSNISALKNKIEFLLKQNKKITVVHPIAEQKVIKTFDSEHSTVTTRKSPKKQTIYSVLRSLTGIYSFLTEENFTLEIIFTNQTEYRQKTEEKVQSKNKARRHLRAWITTDKTLDSINSKTRLKTKKDYKKLLPDTLPQQFTPPQLYKAIFELKGFEHFTDSQKKSAAKNYSLLIWLLEKMKIIKKTGLKQGRSWIYQIL